MSGSPCLGLVKTRWSRSAGTATVTAVINRGKRRNQGDERDVRGSVSFVRSMRFVRRVEGGEFGNLGSSRASPLAALTPVAT